MLIECHDLNYQYSSSNTQVFQGLSWRIQRSWISCLVRTIGRGQDNIGKMIAGLVKGFSGEIKVDPTIGILYTYNLERLPGWSVVGEHLRELHRRKKPAIFKTLPNHSELRNALKPGFPGFHLGQQNRTNLTRYLLQDFDLLIMDESLANVDEATRETIILEIKRVFSQKTFLYISHNVVEVAKFCKDILVLRDVRKSPQITVIKGQDHTENMHLIKGH
jgi:ABC-type nitrate/sulfonate/bicarbonate transport system ATPase subunit